MNTYYVQELITSKRVTEPSPDLAAVYAERDKLQDRALAAGRDLNQERYAVRCGQ